MPKKKRQDDSHISRSRRDRFEWDTSEGITIERAPEQPEQIPPDNPPAKRK